MKIKQLYQKYYLINFYIKLIKILIIETIKYKIIKNKIYEI